jgi:hypothetical protein
MPQDGSLTVGDLAGKLEVLNVACSKCKRRGRYRISTLLAQLGPNGRLTEWRAAIMADCPKVLAASHWDACGAHLPDLVRLFSGPR